MNKIGFYDKAIAGCLLATALVFTGGSLVDSSSAETEVKVDLDFYKMVSECTEPIIVDSEELTLEVLESRNGRIIIEKVIGEVMDSDLNGAVLNAGDSCGAYISYSNCDVEMGDVVVSYFVYNPDTNFHDDVIARYDYVIDSTKEEID